MQFGVPLYGASLDGKLKYVPDNSLGCEPFASDAFTPEGEFIALVQRGGKNHAQLWAVV